MNWILSALILGACALALRALVRTKQRKGTLCAGCPGCGDEGGCPFSRQQPNSTT